VSSPIWGSSPDIYYFLAVTVLFLWGALSDKRMGLSFVYAAGPLQRSLSWVRVPWHSWPYFTVSDLRLSFSSPRTTRRVTVEVFDPASTHKGPLAVASAPARTEQKTSLPFSHVLSLPGRRCVQSSSLATAVVLWAFYTADTWQWVTLMIIIEPRPEGPQVGKYALWFMLETRCYIYISLISFYLDNVF
jgi:hypothetical protein